ncbi:LytR/AlgR family response regulator transcription factor [Permianibacter aggregans]|uniref:LytTR family two component transcriptional regulator n=1 Tax=Permianibacter aggregans TaxID=1510150 RepID=A0A4R6UQJ7_9GAMM|nr:LytTR family DNA-binding domain-containing protein [Permianibacter aggregans]QGX40354.1 response regulator transcription factor [Permianibacter aggregans]TDQ49520.1 LytTR family two component transcriptional regulator [Permianibacter aggregans]
MKLLLVDDEPLARERLRALIQESFDDIDIVAEAADGVQALAEAGKHLPDVVLLDVRMPGMDGIETARHLAQLEPPPAVIFTTAYDDYALEAFGVHALGYLLKPIKQDKLEAALQSVIKPNRAQIAALKDGVEKSTRTHISARVRGNLVLIKLSDVFYFQADQKYITVRHRDGEVLIEEALKDLENEFAPRFIRIHRNALVALDAIAAVERDALGRTVVRLRDIDESLEVSRRHLADLRELLKAI